MIMREKRNKRKKKIEELPLEEARARLQCKIRQFCKGREYQIIKWLLVIIAIEIIIIIFKNF